MNRRQARKSLTEFCRYVAPFEPPAEHHRLLCEALDKVIAGEIRNLMVFMPPGSAKSTYASVRFPAYYLGRLGKKSIICGSYGGDLATSFGRKVRNLVDSKECRNVFSDLTLTEDSRAKGEWETKEGGTYFAVGVGGGVTGRRGDLGLIDDPVKGRKEADSDTIKEETWNWYNSDFLTRLKPGAAQVIIQTRWADDDLSGRILPEGWDGESGQFQGTDGKTWYVISLSAQAEAGKNDPLGRKAGEWLWTDYFTEDFWKETKDAQERADIRNWEALYQQRPTPEGGTFFRREWFNRYEIGKHPDHLVKYGASDYAVTDDGGDFTEQGVAGISPESKLYLLDWIRGQDESDVWVEDLLDLHESWNPLIWGAEGGQIKKAIAPWLKKRSIKRNIFPNIEQVSNSGGKAANARSFQGMAKLGLVYIPMCEWGDALIRQLVKFPGGTFDDGVDVCGILGRLVDRVWEIAPEDAPKPPKVHDYPLEDDEDGEESWKTA